MLFDFLIFGKLMTYNTWPERNPVTCHHYITGQALEGTLSSEMQAETPLWPSVSTTEKADLWGDSLVTDKNKNESPFVKQVNTKQKARFLRGPRNSAKFSDHIYILDSYLW